MAVMSQWATMLSRMGAPTRPSWANHEIRRLKEDDRLATTIASYDRAPAQYARRFADADLHEHRLRFQAAMKVKAPVLDAGCGAGRDCSLFERDGLSPVGLDLSLGLLREARKVSHAPLVLGDIRSLPFGAGSFQGAWCCAVLLHLDDVDAFSALTEMFRVLVAGGVLFVSVRLGERDEWRNDPRGFRRWFRYYSTGELTSLIAQAGFALSGSTAELGVVSAGTWINVHAFRQ